MSPRSTKSPAIPSFFSVLRCTCGRASDGRYCDGSHLDAALGSPCDEQRTPPQGPGTEEEHKPGPTPGQPGAEVEG
jgi:CDGSH-type Zn-finger protein